MKLWKQGESIYLSGQQEDGTHAQTKYFRREEYLPINTTIELEDREFRVNSVNFEQGTVSLQDMTLAKEARYPIFRTEPLEYIRHVYTIQALKEVQPLVAEDAEMAALVQQTIPKMQRLNEQQFKGLELEWHRPEDDAGK